MTTDPRTVRHALSLTTSEATVWYESFPEPIGVPRVGDDVYAPGTGIWRVLAVRWDLPSWGALTPTMWVTLTVEWSPVNTKPAPVYDEDEGWVTQ